jgi:plasmid stabilization system protein ParE
MSGYAFHPAAFGDLDEIWEYIAQDNLDAADGVLADIHESLRVLAASPTRDGGHPQKSRNWDPLATIWRPGRTQAHRVEIGRYRSW